jgi:hypothetical protein
MRTLPISHNIHDFMDLIAIVAFLFVWAVAVYFSIRKPTDGS